MELEQEPLPELGLSGALLVDQDEKSQLDKIYEMLLDPKSIGHHTELTNREIQAFSVLSTLARKYDLGILQDFLVENLVLRVSKSRGGRKELVKMVSQFQAQEQAAEMPGKLGRFMRRR